MGLVIENNNHEEAFPRRRGRNSKGGVIRHLPGSQMIFSYISLRNRLKMEKLVMVMVMVMVEYPRTNQH